MTILTAKMFMCKQCMNVSCTSNIYHLPILTSLLKTHYSEVMIDHFSSATEIYSCLPKGIVIDHSSNVFAMFKAYYTINYFRINSFICWANSGIVTSLI